MVCFGLKRVRVRTVTTPVLLTNHLSLIVDHHCEVLKDLVYIHDVRLKQTKSYNQQGQVYGPGTRTEILSEASSHSGD